MIIDGTDYLFHYTTIEKLALILTNKTIRLNALSKMDDLQECKTQDLKNLGDFFFASCWTDNYEESIPMWKMYTDIKSGVMIALPKNPFVRQGTNTEELVRQLGVKTVEYNSSTMNTFLDYAELSRLGVLSVQAWGGNILTKIEYTDDTSILEPKTVFDNGERFNIDTSKIGKYKNKYWEDQNEWRYLMCFIPYELKGDPEQGLKDFTRMANQLRSDNLKPPFDHFDLSIRDDALEKMLIMPSPGMTMGNRILLDALLKDCDFKGTMRESKLNGLI